jgi:hypothetical protein
LTPNGCNARYEEKQMPVKEMASPERIGAGAPPISARKRIQTDSAPELMETPLIVRESPVPADEGYGGEGSSKRRMPENLKKFLLRVQGGKLYLPAAYRMVWFRDECPDWGVSTDVIEGGQEAGFATVKATVFNAEGRVIATGHKTETRSDFPAGHVEKAETGAIARALAVAGFGTQFSPELDEEVFADSPQPMPARPPARRESPRYAGGHGNGHASHIKETPAPMQTDGDTWEGPGQCPTCHAPAGKRHGKACSSA